MTTPNARQPYWKICREEQNFAAVLYAALCREDKARIFLNLCGFREPIARGDLEIYFEYAYLRDSWKTFKTDGERKAFINDIVKIEAIERILRDSDGPEHLLDIYRRLCGGKGNFSSQVQMPGLWDLKKLMTLRDAKEITHFQYEKLCKFKWAFNIKPDIVIHLGANRAICIETKHESGEGKYSDKGDPPFRCGQLSLQQYLMNDVLGFKETKFVYIASTTSQEAKRSGCIELTWGEVFDRLGMIGEGRAGDYLPFVFHLVDNVSKVNKKKT